MMRSNNTHNSLATIGRRPVLYMLVSYIIEEIYATSSGTYKRLLVVFACIRRFQVSRKPFSFTHPKPKAADQPTKPNRTERTNEPPPLPTSSPASIIWQALVAFAMLCYAMLCFALLCVLFRMRMYRVQVYASTYYIRYIYYTDVYM